MSIRVGIAGSGYIARGLVLAIMSRTDMTVARILTRSRPAARTDLSCPERLTNSLHEMLDASDVVVECSGDVAHATAVVDAALSANLPVVTMDAEMQVTTGSHFCDRGMFTEAEGDQPGCLAAMGEEVRQMGFVPLVYGNVKGFLNHDPSREDMHYWAVRQGISLDKCVAFTDGTKVQIEQALVANGLGADIACDGLVALRADDLKVGAMEMAARAVGIGRSLSDFIVAPASPPGVFIVATHQERQEPYLRNFKLGDGPFYFLLRNFHLCHLEVPKTILRVMNGGSALLNNTPRPRIGVAAVAKRDIEAGFRLEQAVGSFDVRGIAVRLQDNPGYVPIGLLAGATLRHRVEKGQMLLLTDVDLPDNVAVRCWTSMK